MKYKVTSLTVQSYHTNDVSKHLNYYAEYGWRLVNHFIVPQTGFSTYETHTFTWEKNND